LRSDGDVAAGNSPGARAGPAGREKAFKAFLIGNGQLYPLTHDLERLRELCVAIDSTLDAVARPCLDLTQLASLMRYPGCPDLPEPDLAWPWLHAAEALVDAVAERLGVPQPRGPI
jgi:HEPN domain-containing protein